MKFSKYLHDNLGKQIIMLIFGVIFSAVLFIFNVDISIPICFIILYSLSCILIIMYDFFRKRKFYNNLNETLSNLEHKYLLPEMITEPRFLEGRVIYNALHDTDKSMNEHIAEFKNQTSDFRDFIELWVHEIKTPLTGLALSANKNQKQYISSIENYIEQALYYSKISTVDKDYIIKRICLKDIVNNVIRSNKEILMEQKIKIELTELDDVVLSDPKWLQFIINQIIQNSIKYRSKNPTIKISSTKFKNKTALEILDNGIGIKPSELKHITEKGFTGSNDRKTKASTGMGLYIAEKLSTDLGHKLIFESELNKYTKVCIKFGYDDFHATTG